jgi:hypothetical protein
MLTNYPAIRTGIYVAAIAAQIASFFLVLSYQELATAFVATSGLLASVAGVTALSNVTPNIGVDSGFRDSTSE